MRSTRIDVAVGPTPPDDPRFSGTATVRAIPERCVKRVSCVGRFWRVQCSRKGREVVAGKLLCTQHAKKERKLSEIRERFK